MRILLFRKMVMKNRNSSVLRETKFEQNTRDCPLKINK